jgi:hypothetical protein
MFYCLPKKSFLLAIACIFCCFSVLFAQKSLKDFRGVAVKRADCKRIVWENTNDGEMPTVGYIDAKQKFHKITIELDILMLIDTIYISPKQKNALIFSSGEGHPYLTVYPIVDMIKNNKAAKGKTLNPYPSWTNNEKWITDNKLQFTSELDFDKHGKPIYKENAPEKTWIWNVNEVRMRKYE